MKLPNCATFDSKCSEKGLICENAYKQHNIALIKDTKPGHKLWFVAKNQTGYTQKSQILTNIISIQ